MNSPEPLIFPRGVRFPRPDEFPAGREAEKERLLRARVTTGFVGKAVPNESYRAYFEANVHAPEIGRAFRTLAADLMPDVAAPIVGFKGEDPTFGPYTDRDLAVSVFEPHMDVLQHDGFIEFGVIFRFAGRTEEIFVRPAKYFQVWTNRPDVARRSFESLGLVEVPSLEFIDEYAHVTEALVDEQGKSKWPSVLERIRESFEALPRREPPAAKPPHGSG